MTPEPRQSSEYGSRETEAAHRAMVDIAQVLGSFKDCMVIIGGSVPPIHFPKAEEPHVGSIDVDIALDIGKLKDGRYAELLKLLVATGRYKQGPKEFQFVAAVDLGDGKPAVQVEIDFLASKKAKARRKAEKLMPGFRVLQADGCEVAFRDPKHVVIAGRMINGAENSVEIQVVSLPDFLIMKAYALKGRDKPKDAYDISYCLDNVGDGMAELAKDWLARDGDPDVHLAIGVLKEKFATIGSFGPMQVMEFHNSTDPEERAMQARRAYELVQRFLALLKSPSVS